MPSVRFLLRIVPVALVFAWAAPARAQVLVPDGFHDDLIASGFSIFSNFDFLPDRRVLITEQRTGCIILVDPTGVVSPDTVGVVPEIQATNGEAGLIGIAVDPRWPVKPYIYVDYSNITSPNIRVVRYALTGDLDGTQGTGLNLDLTSRHDILADLPDDFPIHNGGTLRFAADGMLFVSVGDDNVPCAAQDLHELRGKLLRLSVLGVPDGPGWAPDYVQLTPPGNPFNNPDPRMRLVWAYGLRNPWTYDFDRATGAVVIADVGNDEYEEIDFASPDGGQNFGWPLYEGPLRYDYPLCTYSDTLALVTPAYFYPHQGGAAIIMGGVARYDPGALANFPGTYDGNLFFTDLYDGRLRRLVCTDGTCVTAPPVPGQADTTAWATGLPGPTRMRFGPDGGLWYVTAGGEVHRIRADLVLAADPPRAGALELRAYPVPAAGPMRFSWTTPRAGRTSLSVIDARGRRVRTLVPDGPAGAGEHLALWDGADERGVRVAPGVYFGALRTEDRTTTKRVVVLGVR